MKRAVIVFLAAAALAACKKVEKKSSGVTAPVTAGTVRADGSREVAVVVTGKGFQPDSIQARPNEKLRLVFTRTEDSECAAQVKVADGKVHELPMNQPVPIEVTVPASGKVAFACGMDMMSGVILVGS